MRSALREQKVAVLVDNVQNYDDTTLRFLNELVTGLRDGSGRAVLVLSFNCDFVLPGTRAQGLRDRLVGLARDGGQSAFTEFQLGDFSREDFYAFLDNCVSVRDGGAATFTYRFGQIAALLHQRVQSRPLFLEQMLLHLEERRVLRREQDRLYLEDIPNFQRELNTLPAKVRGIMEKRWAFVRDAIGPPAEQLLRTLVFLVAAPLWLLKEAGCSTEIVLALEARGLLRLTERDRVTFYHSQVFRFFDDVLKLPGAVLASELLPVLGAPGVRDDYYLQWFLARDVAGALTHEDVVEAVHEARRKMGRDERSHDFLRALERRLRRSDVQVEPTIRLETLVWLCGELKHAHFAERLEAFQKLWSEHVRPMEESYREIGPTYFYFVREYANAHFSIHADPKALPLLRSTVDRVKEFGFADEESRARWTAEILNRLCVVYKSIGEKDDAVDCARRSLRLARVARHLPMQIFNRVDSGYIYYGFADTRRALVEQWRPAVTLFERSRRARPEVAGLRSMIRVKEVVLRMLDGQMDDAAAMAMQEAHYCETILEAFYRVRYLTAFVVCKLTAAGADSGELQAIVEDAQDWCVRFQADRSYWNTFYVESKVRAAAGDQYGSVTALRRAFEQLQKTLAQPSMEWLYAAFYEDLALQLRRMTGEVPKEILHGVRSHETRRLIGRTAEMSDAQFDAWLSAYTPSATFHDGRFNLPTP